MEEIIKELLEETGIIYEKEKKNKQKQLGSGELFNIFEILSLEHYETTTHSPMLAELLNPQGMHGCNDQFLKVFLKEVLRNESFLNTTDAIVEVEKVIGWLDNDYEQGGRIDILIHDDNNAIVIENKIDAGDQPKQLYRYCRYAQKNYKNYRVLYLTLDGKEPSVNSVKGNDSTIEVNPICISYQYHIKSWLEKCSNVADKKPNIKNSLNQYIHIINKLTNQDMETESKEKIVELLSSPENITNVLLIKETANDAINAYLKKNMEPFLESIVNDVSVKELNLTYSIYAEHWCNDQWIGFKFQQKEWKTFSIGFEFMKNSLQDCNYGFKFQKEQDLEKNNEDIKSKAEKLHSEFGGKSSKWWACYRPFEIQNWYNADILIQISEKGKSKIKTQIIKAIKDCIYLAQDIEL